MDLPAYDRPRPGWEIDRRIPVALLLAILGNAFLTGWWAATTSARLGVLEAAVSGTAKLPEGMARLDEKLNSLHDDVTALKEDVRRLGIRGDKR